MVGERWPTDSIRSSSPLILLFFNFVLDIFLRPPKKKKGYELIDLSTCRIDSFLLYNIDRENKKKMSVYSEEPARPDCYSARYFSFFLLCCATIHRTATREKTAIKSILNCLFPGCWPSSFMYYDPTYTRATCVTY